MDEEVVLQRLGINAPDETLKALALGGAVEMAPTVTAFTEES